MEIKLWCKYPKFALSFTGSILWWGMGMVSKVNYIYNFSVTETKGFDGYEWSLHNQHP